MKKKSKSIDEILEDFMHGIIMICACEKIPEARIGRREMELGKTTPKVRKWAKSKVPKKKVVGGYNGVIMYSTPEIKRGNELGFNQAIDLMNKNLEEE